MITRFIAIGALAVSVYRALQAADKKVARSGEGHKATAPTPEAQKSGGTAGAAPVSTTRDAEQNTSTLTVRERVRAAVDQSVARPRAIEVTEENGTITLTGPIFAEELERLIAAIEDVEGVQRIQDHMEVQLGADAEDLRAL